MFVPDSKCVLMPDGRLPRISISNPTVAIGAHVPLLGIGTPHTTQRRVTFEFDYDPAHLSTVMTGHYKVYALSNERISFDGIDKTKDALDLSSVVKVSSVTGAPAPKFDPAVLAGTDPVVVARVDITGATGFGVIPVESDPLLIGTVERKFAETVDVYFNLLDDTTEPVIRTIDKDGAPSEIRLKAGTDAEVIIANIELEDVMMIASKHPHNQPLVHFELLYDLYKFPAGTPRPVPAVTQNMTAGHGQNGDGHCGPPAQP